MESIITERTSRQINFLKFVCTIGIVCLHTSYLSVHVGSDDLMVRSLDWLVFVRMVRVAVRVCVPTFFLLSGFLFCQSYDWRGGVRKNLEWFKRKFQRRVKTLLVPYLTANIVVFLCFYCSNFILSGLMQSGNSYCLYDNWKDFLLIFWEPADTVLWFLRDLMIVSVLTPMILPLVKWSRGLLVVVFGLLWYFDIWETGYDGFSSVSFFFFYLGCWIAYGHSHSPLTIRNHSRLLRRVCCVIAVASWWYSALINHTVTADHTYILTGVVTLVCVVDQISESRLKSLDARFWMPACFFIYAYHSMIQIPMKKGLYVLIRPENLLWNYAIYFSTVAFTIAFLAGIYWLMRRVMPRFSWFFTGR